jgi:hypothetical protein
MDVIDFLCVSLGSSTVQLHCSLGSWRACACSEAGFSTQNGDRAWGVYYRRTQFCCAVFVGETTHCKYILKEMFPIYGWKCLSRKTVHNWDEKFPLNVRKSQMMPDQDALLRLRQNQAAETTVKRPPCCGFRRTGKAMGQVYQCWWTICREINVFSRFKYHVFFVSYSFVTLTDSPSYLHEVWHFHGSWNLDCGLLGSPKDGDSTFIWKVGNHLRDYTLL